tara:strand:+ start:507 stop:839 length:333 start_codon:yes stop_codon:yes gene_type:complete
MKNYDKILFWGNADPSETTHAIAVPHQNIYSVTPVSATQTKFSFAPMDNTVTTPGSVTVTHDSGSYTDIVKVFGSLVCNGTKSAMAIIVDLKESKFNIPGNPSAISITIA